jgi:hypothetical protein
MANASPSSTPTTTPTPSSAWRRLVQITRTASESSRSRSHEPSSHLNETPASDHISSSVPPTKKRRLAESPPARSVTKYFASLAPNSKDLRDMSPGKATDQISSLSRNIHDCITACPCRVEHVDCVAPQQQQQDENTGRCTSRGIGKLRSTTRDSDPGVTPQRPRTKPRPSASQRVPNASPRPDEFESTRDSPSKHLREASAPEHPDNETNTTDDLGTVTPSGSVGLGDNNLGSEIVWEKTHAARDHIVFTTGSGLQESDQNTVNKVPVSRRHSSSPKGTDEGNQRATPSSSPTAKTDSRADEAPVQATKPHMSAPAPKTKRRLTLHGGGYERQSSHKKRKAAPKRKDGVQTTLSLAIGSSAGMRECKLCDTVYNPFHPEDVKVHSRRHAIAVKREHRSEVITGPTFSTLLD